MSATEEVSMASAAPPAVAKPRPRSARTKEIRLAGTHRRDAVFRRSLIVADTAALLVALFVAGTVVGDDRVTLFGILSPLALIPVAKMMGLYDRDEHRLHKTTLQDVPAVLGIATAMALLAYLGGDLVFENGSGRAETFSILIVLLASTLTLRALARFVARTVTPPERCLLVGNSTRPLVLLDALAMSPATHAEIVGILPMLGRASLQLDTQTDLDDILDEQVIDRVIVLPGSQGGDELMFAIRELRDAGVKVSLFPDITRLAGAAVELDNIGGVTLLGMRRFAIARSSLILKRWFDLVLASFFVVLLLPVFILVALAVRFDSPGGALFRQERIGRHGRRFMMLKFRSMKKGSEHQREEFRHLCQTSTGLFKIPNDPRITRVGAFIRRTSVDELPQLLNVLRGDMSLVGPRPLVPEEDEQIVGEYRNRLDVRPGITGHWQILGAARVSLDEMVKLDYLYIANWSLWNDVVLILRTIPVVLRRRGQ